MNDKTQLKRREERCPSCDNPLTLEEQQLEMFLCSSCSVRASDTYEESHQYQHKMLEEVIFS